jgi:dTDP-4-dehydrorhamnose reductase
VKVLVTGAGGQLGRELVERLGAGAIGFDHATLDVTDGSAVRAAVRHHEPDAVVHAAAWTAVDACEGDPDRAHLVNETATRHVAEAAAEVGAHLTYISTDYVFDGTKPAPYVESDPVNPRSVYGRSKYAGELAAGPDALIVRTSWVCGRYGPNMVATILRLAAEPGELTFVDDQRGHPTFARDLARKVTELVRARHRGTFHVTNQGPAVSWFEFARGVLERSGHDPDRVRPVATADLHPPRPAPRPANSVLDNAELDRRGIPRLQPATKGLQRLLADYSARDVTN